MRLAPSSYTASEAERRLVRTLHEIDDVVRDLRLAVWDMMRRPDRPEIDARVRPSEAQPDHLSNVL